MKWIISRYMANNFIASVLDLAKRTGLNYDVLRGRIKHPKNMRLWELAALNDVLNFSDEDLLTIIKGGKE